MDTEFKSNKLQLKVTNPAAPRAFHRLFNNVCQAPTSGQVTAVVDMLQVLTADNVQNISLATSQQITLK